MEKFPYQKNKGYFDMYYHNENLENTNLAAYEELDNRRPDAYLGFSNIIFFYPQPIFSPIEDIDDKEWYD